MTENTKTNGISSGLVVRLWMIVDEDGDIETNSVNRFSCGCTDGIPLVRLSDADAKLSECVTSYEKEVAGLTKEIDAKDAEIAKQSAALKLARSKVYSATICHPNGVQFLLEEALAAIDALKASPASAPEGWARIPEALPDEPIRPDESINDQINHIYFVKGWNACREAMLAAAPTPPVSEDRKDAELFRFLLDDHTKKETRQKVRGLFERLPVMSLSAAREAIDAAMQEDKP
jgi:hypothetical protein